MKICFLVFKTLKRSVSLEHGHIVEWELPSIQARAHRSELNSPLLLACRGKRLFKAVSLEAMNTPPPPFPLHRTFWCKLARSGALTSKHFPSSEAVVHLRFTWVWKSYLLSCPFRMKKQSWSLCRFTFSRVASFQDKVARERDWLSQSS